MSSKPIYLPPFRTPAKPEYMSPCNGCGWCCHEQVCRIGMGVFKLQDDTGPCPAIEYVEGKVRCGVVLAEREIFDKPKVAEMLGIGMGCDAQGEMDRPGARDGKKTV